MSKYRCIIVDDEKLARDLIKSHLNKISSIEIIGECGSAVEAMTVLNEHTVDILYLDVNMPHLSGVDFLKQLYRPPLTILTTAYSEYALEGYELNIVDYLLKPIEFDRFIKGTNKALRILSDRSKKPMLAEQVSVADDTLFVKSDYKNVKINKSNIIYIEAMQKYVRFHTIDKKVMTLMSLSKATDELGTQSFMKIHRSYVVNTQFIDAIEGNMVHLGGTTLPVGKSYRATVQEYITSRQW